ncbi:TPA: polyprenyl synthetase family protein [archaeon]|nr:polyprenyl synthetase family protein [Candidatus Naiadarchaeales archaeon SRR2090153.bin1042]
MNIERELARHGKLVDREINRVISENFPKNLYEPIKYHLGAGGKRIRPALCLLSCEAIGGKVKNVLPIATAIEMIHGFSLIHDDIEDRDELRRGNPTVWKVWGEALAINAGDGLFTKAFESAANLKGKNSNEALKIFARAVLEVCEGQALDISFEKSDAVTEKDYLEMTSRKTGALMEAACKTGALIGGGSKKEVNALANYGRKIGIAFQIWDDYIDFASEKTGKTFGLDIKKGKKTFIVCHALARIKGEDRARLFEILKAPVYETTDEMVREAVEILNNSGSIDYANEYAQKLVNEAKAELKVLKNTKAKQTLLEFADFVVRREY